MRKAVAEHMTGKSIVRAIGARVRKMRNAAAGHMTGQEFRSI